MHLFSRAALCLVVAILAPACNISNAQNKDPVYDDPEKAKESTDFAIQGEYAGEFKGENGPEKVGAQVIALGNGKFECVGYHGGLPGDGWDKAGKKPERHQGELKNGVVHFESTDLVGDLKDGAIVVTNKNGDPVGTLKKVERKSPTLGAKPPEGAVILFDGKTNDFKEGDKKVTKDGLLMQGLNSKSTFQDFSMHIEFRIPFEPNKRGQGRGNSGLYLQGRYEVQMLDSFGLEGRNNECGGIYTIKDPDVNMALPPLTWQTYDVDYTAAKFDDTGKKTANAKITVKHNGVIVHKDVELPKGTTAAPVKEGKEPGPIHLQDHGNPVRYRNIWVVEKK